MSKLDHDESSRLLEDAEAVLEKKLKSCVSCNISMSLDSFHRNKSKQDGRDTNCRKCVSKSKAKSHAEKKRKRKRLSSAKKKPLILNATVKGVLLDDAIIDFVKIFEEAYRGLKYEGKL